ncbi:MAG: hypothetical protein IJ104_06495 [Methanobrevibacter sp.]|nr:hypothetical protein [Methanobrevibacter sp.]
MTSCEKNIYINKDNYNPASILNENNTIFHFDAGTYNLNLNNIKDKNLKFIGVDSTIFTNNNDFFISKSNVQFENIQFKNLRFELLDSTLTINNVEASDINLNKNGGFIFCNNGFNTININKSKFNNNNVLSSTAGTIFLNNGILNCYNSNFTYNTALQSGAVYLNNAYAQFIGCLFNHDVSSDKESGAIFIKNSDCNISNTNFNYCSADNGAALSTLNSKTSVINSNFIGNTVNTINGGIIYGMYGSLSINNTNFKNNDANNGAIIYTDSIIFDLSNVKYSNNKNSINVYAEDSQFSLYRNNTYTPIFSNKITTISSLPSKYNLVDEGYVSSVKDQGIGGNCWAFAALSSLESCILKIDKSLEYDFSEENLKNTAAKYSKYGLNISDTNNGGNSYMAIGYLSNWLGAVNEDSDKYSPTSCISPIFNNIINIQNMYIIKPTADTYDNKNDIKKAILNYGAVVSSYYQDSIGKYFNNKNGINYYNN